MCMLRTISSCGNVGNAMMILATISIVTKITIVAMIVIMLAIIIMMMIITPITLNKNQR